MTAVPPLRSLGERDPSDSSDPSQPRLYLGVIVVEVIVLMALWAFGRYFSG